MTRSVVQRGREAAPAHAPTRTPRVLVMTHSHPRITQGGAEISAQKLCAAMQAAGIPCWFVGCAPPGHKGRVGATFMQPYGADDYLYTPAVAFDYFKFANHDGDFPRALAELVAEKKPDIVHAHHYTMFGVDMFPVIKRANPAARIVVSLHEFLAICHNHGQMVKTDTQRLCSRATYEDCAACFPNHAPSDFFLRRRYIQTHFADVDMFIAPSHFVAGRYIAWGLPEAKVTVLENMPPALAGAAAPRTPSRRVRFGYFGNMSPLKGIIVLMEAARQLEAMGADAISIDIHGEYANQPKEFREAMREALATAGVNVRYHGPYDNAQVGALMARVDAVVVPSIWWENSPVVIQEAFGARRPVICSDIGGMAEKVRPGLDGWHFEAGRADSLADLLADLATRPEAMAAMADTMARPLSVAAGLQAHLAVYARVLS